jgi:hypothetical protein
MFEIVQYDPINDHRATKIISSLEDRSYQTDEKSIELLANREGSEYSLSINEFQDG